MSESVRMILKNIPGNISENQLFEILSKNLENLIYDISIINTTHQADSRFKTKISLFTVKSLEARLKVYEFFHDFEIIDPRGYKHKMIVIDSLHQKLTSSKSKNFDSIESTINDSNIIACLLIIQSFSRALQEIRRSIKRWKNY